MPGEKLLGFGALTLLGWMGLQPDPPIPVVNVNDDDSLLAEWPSESLSDPSSSPPECSFWNGTVQYQSTLCSHFAVARPSSSPALARERALRCAATYSTECILSPEVGLAVPAAFLYNHKTQSMRHVIAPKILPHNTKTMDYAPVSKNVRITSPDTQRTRSELFNTTITSEYLDGMTRSLVTSRFNDEDAFCVQLLRRAFSDGCWKGVD